MNHWKGMPAPELKITPKGNGRYLVTLYDPQQGLKAEVTTQAEAEAIASVFLFQERDYQPNVPKDA